MHVDKCGRVARALTLLVASTVLISCSGDSGGTGVAASGQGDAGENPAQQSTAGQSTAGQSTVGQSAGGSTSDTGESDTAGSDDAGSASAGIDGAGSDDAGSDDAGSDDAGSPGFALSDDEEVPDVATPMPILLATQEELSIDGTFGLLGESNGGSYPEQRFSIVTPPRHGNVIHVSGSRQFTYAPEQDYFGTDSFVYAIESGLAASVFIEVTNVNDAPTIFNDIARVTEQGKRYNEQLLASDPDGDVLVYQAVNLPGWLTLNSASGILSGTPQQSDVGLFENIRFSVTDPLGLSHEITGVRIEVIDVNDAPTINTDQFPSELDAGQLISVNLYPDDPDGDLVKISVEPNDFLGVDVQGSVVSIIADDIPEVTQVNLVVVATDLRGRVSRAIVPLTLYPVNSTGRGRTLRGRNSDGAGVHLVVLGDGYRLDQQAQFRNDVEALIEKMESDPGISTHLSAWNIHMVETPSIDSGIDDNIDLDVRNTVYNTGYFCMSVQRVICGDQPKIFSVAIEEYPNFRQIVVLVNDQRYGGSGGKNIAISSTAALEVALHEMGHSFADLADEYVDRYIPDSGLPSYFEGQFANISNNDNPAAVPWSHWINITDSLTSGSTRTQVGVFEGAYYRANGFYRPTIDSLMRSYDGQLGPVNSEQWALSLYTKTNPVLEIAPVNRLINVSAGEATEFSVVPLFDDSIQLVEWRLGDQLIAHSGGNRPTIELSLPAGRHELELTVTDISGLIRKATPHEGVFTWNWTVVVQ